MAKKFTARKLELDQRLSQPSLHGGLDSSMFVIEAHFITIAIECARRLSGGGEEEEEMHGGGRARYLHDPGGCADRH